MPLSLLCCASILHFVLQCHACKDLLSFAAFTQPALVMTLDDFWMAVIKCQIS